MPRSPIPDLIEQFHNMTPEERACFLDLVDPRPEPEPAKSQKKARKKSASKSSGKSARASSLQQQISSGNSGRSLIQPPAAATVLDDDTVRCQFIRRDAAPCHLLPDHNIHHLESAAEYHEFVPPATDAACAAAGK